jgi:PAS domain S-box-containing protein
MPSADRMEEPIRIVVLSPLESDAIRIVEELKRAGLGVDCERVENALALRGALARGRCDLIFTEWSLQKFSAPAAVEMVKGLGLDVPVVVVTGTFGEDMAAAAFRAGARDFLLREHLHRLPAIVEREVRERRTRMSARGGRIGNAAVLAAALDGIVEVDRSGAVVEFNGAAERIFLSSREEAMGRPIGAFLAAPALWDAHQRALERDLAAARGSLVGKRIETSGLRRDGTEIPIELTITPLDDAGRTSIAFVRDISDRIAERESSKERSRFLEEKLVEMQRMEALGQLTAGIAHDFNNVLVAILSASSLLADEMPESDPRRADALEIRTAAERAASLTRQLLGFSRAQPQESRLVDLNALVTGAEKMLRRLIGEGIDLSTYLGEGLDLVQAPPGQIEQVIVNLVINARDAMPSGGRLRIKTAEVDETVRTAEGPARRWVMVSIGDTGMGMSEETRRQLFEPFFTTKPPGMGTGLGLFTSHAIVTRHGGTISVRSEPGAGSVFEVYLPGVAREESAAAPAPAPAEVAGGSETILLVEDDDQVRGAVHRILLQHGYRVLSARDGGQAIAISDIFDGHIHLVLSDLVMPGPSGPELVERLRAKRSSLRALFMSGYLADPSQPQRAGVDPALDLLEKPFPPADVLRRVREALDAPVALAGE